MSEDPSVSNQPSGDDEEFEALMARHRRPGRLTIALAVAVVAALTFVGGVMVQKHYGSSATATGLDASGFPAGMPAALRAAAGPGAGGFGDFAGGPASAGGEPGTGGQASSGTQAGAAASPSVVGTVLKISGNTVTVRNFAGKNVMVRVPKAATITVPAGSTLGGALRRSATVSVVGTASSDGGTVTATSITVTS
jgi:hypothetical protein